MERELTAPSTPSAIQWDGWGSALKPANEPICLARKPLSEKSIVENVLKWGTGGINIDGCRAGTEEITTQYPDSQVNSSAFADKYDKSSSIDASNDLLIADLEKLQDPETGWFTKALLAGAVIPIVIVTAVTTTFSGMSSLVAIVTGIFVEFSLPVKLLSLAISFISVFIVYKLVAFFGKGEI
jgi:hypothetical protein